MMSLFPHPIDLRRVGRGAWPVLVLAALLPSCSAFTSDAPPVADSTLVEVMADLYLLQARAEVEGVLPPLTQDSVLARHGVSQEEFEAAMRYYIEHPDAYVDLYDTMLDRLNDEAAGRPGIDTTLGGRPPDPRGVED